jgi:hypothetical protein
MSTTKGLAVMLAGAVMLLAAAPASAAPRTKTNTWHGSVYGAYGAAGGAFAQGSVHLNPNGQPVRTPPACAYPQRYDSGGVAVFQRFGCRLP